MARILVGQRRRGPRHPRPPGARDRPGALGARPGRRLWRRFWPSAFGALLPLLPWFFGGGTPALVASIIIGAVAALMLGAVIGVLPDAACSVPPCGSWRWSRWLRL